MLFCEGTWLSGAKFDFIVSFTPWNIPKLLHTSYFTTKVHKPVLSRGQLDWAGRARPASGHSQKSVSMVSGSFFPIIISFLPAVEDSEAKGIFMISQKTKGTCWLHDDSKINTTCHNPYKIHVSNCLLKSPEYYIDTFKLTYKIKPIICLHSYPYFSSFTHLHEWHHHLPYCLITQTRITGDLQISFILTLTLFENPHLLCAYYLLLYSWRLSLVITVLRNYSSILLVWVRCFPVSDGTMVMLWI